MHPSNPNFNKNWEDIDKRLRELKVTNYQEIYETRKEGSSIKIEDEEIKQKITMADDGYGIADVTGIYENKTVKISTSDNPLATKAPDNKHNATSVLKVLFSTIMKIMDRFK